MKKVISFSLWGNDDMYWYGALANVQLALDLLPDWICRFYIDSSCTHPAWGLLQSYSSVEIVPVGDEKYRKGEFAGAFWRFLAAADKDVSILIVRDCDSRITSREVQIIEKWLASDKDFHVLRDHPFHNVPVLAGMWGCRNGLLHDMETTLEEWDRFDYKGCDQDFLASVIYPRVEHCTFEYDTCSRLAGVKVNDEIQRPGSQFIGDVFDERNKRMEYHREISRGLPHICCVLMNPSVLQIAVSTFLAQDYPNRKLIIYAEISDQRTTEVLCNFVENVIVFSTGKAYTVTDLLVPLYESDYYMLWDERTAYYPWYVSHMVNLTRNGQENESNLHVTANLVSAREKTEISRLQYQQNDSLHAAGAVSYNESTISGIADCRLITDPWIFYSTAGEQDEHTRKMLRVYRHLTEKFWLNHFPGSESVGYKNSDHEGI
ncbi:MAG TPA: hypothetical protein VM802_31390 [Chitinophaga sp.]|uniref:hypothetical protein n=1 Tax=Chitinophaga sp. TaxID=1869181 RepID=UPI002C685075|nr:hypothetical protein [Chitinophaga sp.]HVI49412.1 hypothetical protein [Chitinophaga sp.]